MVSQESKSSERGGYFSSFFFLSFGDGDVPVAVSSSSSLSGTVSTLIDDDFNDGDGGGVDEGLSTGWQ